MSAAASTVSSVRGPVLDLAVGAFAIGWAAIFFRLAGDLSPLLSSALRLAMAFAVLSPWVARSARAGRIGRREVRAAALGGLLYAVHFGAWVASLRWTSVASSVTLVTATPLLLAVLGVLRRHDRPGLRVGAAVALSTVGVALLGAGDAEGGTLVLLGDGLALLGAVAMALYLLLARSLGPGLDAFAFTALSAGMGSVFLALACPLAWLAGDAMALPGAEALGWIAMSALVPQVIGHSLLTRALRDATPTVVGLSTCAEPVLSTLLAALLLEERPGGWVLVGCAVTLSGVLVGVFDAGRSPRPQEGL